ncbi:MAG TPA: hypothetical protein DCS05_08025 [Nitrospiraceae bacterium]|nr:hypothetical protein [Nitrospiraceae bacterium]
MLTNEKKNEIVRSPILAKAILKRENGNCEALVVFAGSTRYEFYWTFRLRSPRSPRRSWKPTNCQMRPTTNIVARPDFQEHVANQALLSKAEVISLRIPHAKRLKALMTMGDIEFDRMIAGPMKEVQPWEQDMVRRKIQSQMRGRTSQPAWNWRTR